MVSFHRFRVLDHALRYIASQRRRSEIMIWGWVKRNQNNFRFVAAVKNDPVVLVGGTVTNVGRFANGQFANVWGRRFANVQ